MDTLQKIQFACYEVQTGAMLETDALKLIENYFNKTESKIMEKKKINIGELQNRLEWCISNGVTFVLPQKDVAYSLGDLSFAVHERITHTELEELIIRAEEAIENYSCINFLVRKNLIQNNAGYVAPKLKAID